MGHKGPSFYAKKIQVWSSKLRKWLSKTLVKTMILYGCSIWALGFSKESWKKVERVQKMSLVKELGVEIQPPYPMGLAKIYTNARKNKYLTFRRKMIMPIYYIYCQNKAHDRNISLMQENIASQYKYLYCDKTKWIKN
jgi:hypothetical protein